MNYIRMIISSVQIARFIRDINMLKLVTDFEGEAWLVRYMDGQVDKLQLKFISDGWSDGKLDFMPNVGHIKRYGRLLFWYIIIFW